MLDDPAPDWQTTLEQVRQTVPADSSIISDQNWWFARPDSPYLSWEQLVYYRRYAPGSTLEDAFRSLRPQYLILDRTTEGYLVDKMDIYAAEYSSSFILRSDMNAFVQKHTRIVSTISTPTFGNVRIYKIVW